METMLNKLITSILVSLIVVSVARPVVADTEDVKIIRVNKYELGGADVHSRMGIPDRVGQAGTFSIEYEIAYRISTTEAVHPLRSSEITATLKALGVDVILKPEQVNPDYIYAEWRFESGMQVSQQNNIPSPAAGDGWCGQRDVRLVCAFPVSPVVGTYYQIQVTYTPTQNCVCRMLFNTDFSASNGHDELEMIVIPTFTNTIKLPIIYG